VSRRLNFGSTPRYRAINLDAVTVDTNLASQCGSGVNGASVMAHLPRRAQTLTAGKDKEYHLGLATPIILPVLQQIQKGIQPKLRILNVEMHTIQMSQARIMGVEEEWIERVEREDLAISYLWCRRSTQATMTACKRATSF
jgi:hypothetical protein